MESESNTCFTKSRDKWILRTIPLNSDSCSQNISLNSDSCSQNISVNGRLMSSRWKDIFSTFSMELLFQSFNTRNHNPRRGVKGNKDVVCIPYLCFYWKYRYS